ncbi:MFS transporter [Nocardia camponoti]|uniref:MFS transporter n=1 Tax=Nocardia camponoti TaxID=1616106 RepID=A0A917Q7Q7_9NOCA|nr:MFS transporter [Nocardia camponoti]GGK34233.1 MFS transporter [Nocardia camponoti]
MVERNMRLRGIVLTLSIVVGATVSNIYYAQPLSGTMMDAFHVSALAIGVVLASIQIGFAVGLAFVVPLGDISDCRKLCSILLIACGVSLLGMSLAPNIYLLVSFGVMTGVASSVVHILVPYASKLAPVEQRGAVVGTVMTGLFTGILLSRTVAGLISDYYGWRWVFGVAAAVTFTQAAVVTARLPRSQPTAGLSYRDLVSSVFELVKRHRELRVRMLYGGLEFAAFSAFWSTVGIVLRDRYGWSDASIGLFALIGVAGIAVARVAGRLVDMNWQRGLTGGFLAVIAISFAVLGTDNITGMIGVFVGAVLLDFAVQGLQVTNQSVVFSLEENAQSRINTAYMTAYFCAGAVGSATAAVAYSLGGWRAVCFCGSLFPLLGLAVWLGESPRFHSSADSKVVQT